MLQAYSGGSSGGSPANAYDLDNGLYFYSPSWVPAGRVDSGGNYPLYLSSFYFPGGSGMTAWSINSIGTGAILQSNASGFWGTVYAAGTNVTVYVSGSSGTTARSYGGYNLYTWTGGMVGYYEYYIVCTAPPINSVSISGRNITVAVGASSDYGGYAPSGYYVQMRQQISGTWTSWGTQQQISSGTTTYSNLTPGRNYQFRAFAQNIAGASAFTTSASIFLPAGGNRYDGATWVDTITAKRYDGSSWIDLSTAKRFDGTNWIDLT